ncbi:MAG TPA: tetratricopeptide repeat protein [Bryobacteraceae bacterium]|jgi:tetratricopeptide (TPR) repeat protein|nr:tetratricopeptide repeat protein [Bryobacteraceae bacterium]
MIRFVKALLYAAPLGSILYAQTPQAATPPAAASPTADDKAGVYYNFAMGRLYAELAANEGNKNNYLSQAIQHYREALRLDPHDSVIFDELTDLYIQTNRLADAVSLAEDLLKADPQNLDARRMLGRVYTRMIGEGQGGRVDEKYVRQAIEQYQQITQKDPKDTESWVMLGRLYRVSNSSPEAEKAYRAALAVDPNNEDAITGLAMLYADLGDSKKAIDTLKDVAAHSPNERTLQFLAEQYEQMKDYKDAAAVLKKAYDLAPDNLRIARSLALDLMYSDQLDEALKLFQELGEEDPRDVDSQIYLSKIYTIKHDLANARAAIDKAKKASPENLDVRYQDAQLLLAENKNDQALQALKSMLDDTMRRSYSKTEADLRSRLLEEYGIVSRTAGKYDQAIDAFRQFGQLGADYAVRGEVQVIDTYRQKKDYPSALKESEAAIKKYPDKNELKIERATVLADAGKLDEGAAELKGIQDVKTQLALAELYQKAKRYPDMSKALDAAEQAAKNDDERETIYFMRGAMYERMKKYEESEAAFRKVLAINPDNAEALNYLGYMLADRGVRLDEAQKLIQKALDQAPNNGAFLDSLGWVYYRQGKLNEAEGMLVQAIEQIGDDGTVHDHLGDVYFKLGKTKEAVAQWQASLQQFRKSPEDADADEVAKVTRKLEDARVKLAKENR